MALQLTPVAATRIKTLAIQRGTPDHLLRVGIRGGGCSGMSYFIDFTPAADDKDKIIPFPQSDGSVVTLAVDRKSYLFLINVTLDWQDELMKTGFVFVNPAAKSTCGCGDSFSA